MATSSENLVEDQKFKWKFMDEFWFRVQFVLKSEFVGHEVSSVYLAGDFNRWKLHDSYRMNPCSEGYSLTLLLSQGYYQYKFVLMVPSGGDEDSKEEEAEPSGQIWDEVGREESEMQTSGGEFKPVTGAKECSLNPENFLCCPQDELNSNSMKSTKFKQVWITDPNCPYVGGVYGNSIMFVHMDPKVYGLRSQHPPHRDYHRLGSNGSEFHTLCPPLPPDIEAQGTLQRLIFIYLPPSYHQDETRRYPVLYANDGEALFSTPSHAGGPCKGGYYLDEKLDYFWDQKLLPEFILVGIPNSDFVCNGNRTLEYCTSVLHDTSRDPYKRYLVEVVKREVDCKYRTLSDSDNTVIMGGSMGGLCAFVLCLNHPDLFSAAVCVSSSFWHVDKHNKTAYDLLRSRSGNFSYSDVDGNTCIKANDQESSDTTVKSDSLIGSTSSSSEDASLPSLAGKGSVSENSQFPTPSPAFSPNLRPRIYIDSGDGPGDNFYETKEMNETFVDCGWKEGEEFKYVLDECAKNTEDGITHLEAIWKERILQALQFVFKFTPV